MQKLQYCLERLLRMVERIEFQKENNITPSKHYIKTINAYARKIKKQFKNEEFSESVDDILKIVNEGGFILEKEKY